MALHGTQTDGPGGEEAVIGHDASLESAVQWDVAAPPRSPPSVDDLDTGTVAAATTADAVDATRAEASNKPAAAPAPDKRKQSSKAARAVALELYNLHTPMHVITERTGIMSGAFYALIRRATQRGFSRGCRVLDEHVVDAHRSGRPQTAERTHDGKRKRRKRAVEAVKAANDEGMAGSPAE